LHLHTATLPSLLLSDDVGGEGDDDSDLEIDPGTLSPPPPGSPLRMRSSPTVQEMLSAMGEIVTLLVVVGNFWIYK